MRLIGPTDDPDIVGDEPILLARRTGAPVAMGRDRPAASQLLVNAGCDVVVSDDGLQHYALARDCEIVVIDGDRRFGNGWLLPAGPLREPPGRLATADAIVVNGGRAMIGRRPQHANGGQERGGSVRRRRQGLGRVCRTKRSMPSPASATRSAFSICCARMASRSSAMPCRTMLGCRLPIFPSTTNGRCS